MISLYSCSFYLKQLTAFAIYSNFWPLLLNCSVGDKVNDPCESCFILPESRIRFFNIFYYFVLSLIDF